MPKRIRAAWKVLRGEWVAQPKNQILVSQPHITTGTTTADVRWKVTPYA